MLDFIKGMKIVLPKSCHSCWSTLMSKHQTHNLSTLRWGWCSKVPTKALTLFTLKYKANLSRITALELLLCPHFRHETLCNRKLGPLNCIVAFYQWLDKQKTQGRGNECCTVINNGIGVKLMTSDDNTGWRCIKRALATSWVWANLRVRIDQRS